MEKDITKHYSNGEVTIVWKPSMCIHSTVCWKEATGLPSVFNPRERPWIKPEGSPTKAIVDQVNRCPSGALSFFFDNADEDEAEVVDSNTKIEVSANGPLLVYGNIVLKDKEGNESRRSKVTAFCRCGQSKNKPFCDGSHVPSGFEG
jgi:uncharacterized Fe-S cluster protein YjdI